VGSIAAFTETGAATKTISRLQIGFKSTLLPTVVIITGISGLIISRWWNSGSGNRDTWDFLLYPPQ